VVVQELANFINQKEANGGIDGKQTQRGKKKQKIGARGCQENKIKITVLGVCGIP